MIMLALLLAVISFLVSFILYKIFQTRDDGMDDFERDLHIRSLDRKNPK